jgi:hypothetical protein
LHVLRVELGDEGQDLGHVLDALVEELERLVALDFLVGVGVGLLGGHVTGLLDEAVGVDLVPEGLLPGVELGIDAGDEIPVLFEVEEVDAAVIELLELGLSQIEKSLQVAETLGLLLHDGGLIVVVVNLGVRFVDDFDGRAGNVVGAVLAELLSEVIDTETEITHGGFDVLSLLLLDGEDASLDGSESLLGDIGEVGLDVLENDKEVLVGLHVHEVLLQEHNSLLHGLNPCDGVLSDHLDVTEVLHDLHESVLLRLSLTALGQVLNALLDALDEVLDVADLGRGVLEQELGVLLDPLVDGGVELLNQLLGADLEPANVVVHLLAVNRVLH